MNTIRYLLIITILLSNIVYGAPDEQKCAICKNTPLIKLSKVASNLAFFGTWAALTYFSTSKKSPELLTNAINCALPAYILSCGIQNLGFSAALAKDYLGKNKQCTECNQKAITQIDDYAWWTTTQLGGFIACSVLLRSKYSDQADFGWIIGWAAAHLVTTPIVSYALD